MKTKTGARKAGRGAPRRAAARKGRTSITERVKLADIDRRNQAIRQLLEELMADESGYQEAV